MTFQVIGTAAKDPNFQNRCRGCFIKIGSAILGAGVADGSIRAPVTNADLTTQDCKDLVLKYCSQTNKFTDQTLASFMLLSGSVAAAPYDETDDGEYAFEYQMQFMFMRLVGIG